MKRIIFLICICVFFVSCVDKYKCINNIQAEFPYGEVHHIEETPYFLVIDSIGVYIVSCNTPFSYDVYSKTLIKKWNKEETE